MSLSEVAGANGQGYPLEVGGATYYGRVGVGTGATSLSRMRT